MKKIIYQLASAPRLAKQALLVFLDLVAFPVILWLCYVIRLFDLGAEVVPGLNHGVILITFLSIISLLLTGVYHFIVRTFDEVFIIKLAFAVCSMMIILYGFNAFSHAYIPMSIPFMFGFMMFAWIWCSRAFIRFIVKATLHTHGGCKRVVIYGAGDAGQQIAAALHRSDDHTPVFFIDDKVSLQDQIVGGLKVYSTAKALRNFKKYKIDEILLALPSVGRVRKSEIIQQLEPAFVKVTELPGLTKLVDGDIRVSDIREVDIIDLLGRDPVPPIAHLLAKNIQNKIVMVTGAGGSIGSELCRQIIKNQPKMLVLYELTEFALYDIDKELRQTASCDIVPILGTVQDQQKLERIIEQYHVQTVYHAAAYKHVPLVECNPIAGLKIMQLEPQIV